MRVLSGVVLVLVGAAAGFRPPAECKLGGSEKKLGGSEKIFGGSEFFFGGSEKNRSDLKKIQIRPGVCLFFSIPLRA